MGGASQGELTSMTPTPDKEATLRTIVRLPDPRAPLTRTESWSPYAAIEELESAEAMIDRSEETAGKVVDGGRRPPTYRIDPSFVSRSGSSDRRD